MNSTTCGHQHCGQPVSDPSYKFSVAAGQVLPFHAACAYAHPDYEVSKGLGSPFTTITLRSA